MRQTPLAFDCRWLLLGAYFLGACEFFSPPPQQQPGVAGSPGVGGAVATGGNPSQPPPGTPRGYYGFIPAIDPGLASTAYWGWRDRFLEDCGNGMYRVASNRTETVSEAIGYGMLLSVIFDDWVALDGLWAYYQAAADPQTGIMNWRVNGCPPTLVEAGAASDAELDAAMALVMAYCKWGGAYGQDATRLINAIETHETIAYGINTQILKPGPTWGGPSCTNPSYFAPGYYRVFARHVPERAAFWEQLALDSYMILEAASNPSTGLAPNWTDLNGTDGCLNPVRAGGYGYDAARTPWRIAVDFNWWGTPAAQAWLIRISNWAASQGIGNVGDGYALTGVMTSSNHNSTFVGGFATGAMAHSQALVDQFSLELVALNDTNYYEMTLRTLYLLTLTGYFAPSCY